MRPGEWCYFGSGVRPAWGFLADWRDYGLRIALSNLRFNFAYWLGGFTSAKR